MGTSPTDPTDDEGIDDDQLELFAIDSDYAPPREDGEPGPPADWKLPSWFSARELTWYWNKRKDPPPITPLGYRAGEFRFVTAAGEIRTFTSGQLHGRGGLTDLFGGNLWWVEKHFRKWDLEKGDWTGGLQRDKALAALIRACHLTGYYDNARPQRSVGTWRGPDGQPIVHAGDRIFHAGRIHGPGAVLGDAIYVVGGARQAPSHDRERSAYDWTPATVADCHTVAAQLDEWHWHDPDPDSPGATRDLYLGGLWCDMLGDAPLWRPHKFVRAPAGSGKSTLLKYTRAVLGGAAHPIQRSYSKAFLEQTLSTTASAILLDEMESDSDGGRVRHLLELVRLLSDDGAFGGRGTTSGQARTFDVHGTVTMVATVTEAWRPQDRSRIVFLELRGFLDRQDRPPSPPETIAAQIEQAGALSPRIRARAIATFPLFLENLALARARILELGGSPRDGDQLGHLIAGWATATGDQVLSEDQVRALDRFKPFILTVSDAEDGADDSSECFNTLLGLPTEFRDRGQQLTVGQLIAGAREPDSGSNFRQGLLAMGLRLERQRSQITGELEGWAEAWLAVANKHPGLDRLFEKYSQYQGPKRLQILQGLRVRQGALVHEPKPSDRPIRFAGPQSRALLIPPELLPTVEDERQ
jgi:hypothetical protein